MTLALRFSIAALVAAQLGMCLSARGDEASQHAADDATPQTIELAVPAAAEPRPALKFRLYPSLSERTPGNAATYYYRAIVQLKMQPGEAWQKYADRSEAWLTKDVAKYPGDEVQKWLASQQAVLSQIKTAVNREDCDWDLRIQDVRGMAVISFLLAEFQEARNLGRILQLQAHDQIMGGKYDEAVETLREGYRLAHDVGQPPLLIGGLIGIAIGQIMNDELTLLIERSSNNYYWAIAALPRPLVDLRSAMQQEMNLPNQLFPFLKDAETADRSPEEWRQLTIECLRGLQQLASTNQPLTGWQGDLVLAGLLAKVYPAAKQELVAGGLDRERVEAMPVGQVVAIQTARAGEIAFQEVFKLSLLPADEALRRMPLVMADLVRKDLVGPRVFASGHAGLPLASLLLPAVQNVVRADARAARNIAALLAIEAIRMQAAADGGKLPAALADVKVVPVPNNPATGQPFAYAYDATSATATLDVPQVTGGPPNRREALRYVIRLKK